MDYLNYFHPYVSKDAGHEDQLTRAFLVVLKYSPQAMASFYSYCLAQYSTTSLKDTDISLPHFHQLQAKEIQIETQKTNRNFKTDYVLSVLITDAELVKMPEIEASSRNARYDGLIRFDEVLTLIIENKPRSGNVWLDQLSPSEKNLSEEVILIPIPICLEWKEIIKMFNELLPSHIISGAEKLIIEDFLGYIDLRYPVLNPFDSFDLCKGNPTLIERRIKNVLESIAGNAFEVLYHRGWGYHIALNFPSIKMAGLILHEDEKNDWFLELSLYFGIGVWQARNLYNGSIDLENKSDPHLTISPHFRLSFRSQGLIWFGHDKVNVDTYVNYWKKNPDDIRQVKRDELKAYLKKLNDLNVIVLDETVKEKLKTKFFNSKMQNLNVGPGLACIYKIKAEEAIQWDKENRFELKIREFLAQALSVIGEVPKQFEK